MVDLAMLPSKKYSPNGIQMVPIPSIIVRNGHIKRLTDQDIDLPVIEICGTNIINNYLSIPNNPKASLKMKMPILVLLVKNVNPSIT